MTTTPVPLVDNPEVVEVAAHYEIRSMGHRTVRLLAEALRRGWYSTPQACKASGLTYRQIDYLTRVGVVTPIADARGSGSSRDRVWCESDVRLLRLVSYLTNTVGFSMNHIGKVLKGEIPAPFPSIPEA